MGAREAFYRRIGKQPPQRRAGAPAPRSPEAVRRSAELGRLHGEWVDEQLAAGDSIPFRPEGRRDGSDYNVHSVDLEAPAAAVEEFTRRAAAGKSAKVDQEG